MAGRSLTIASPFSHEGVIGAKQEIMVEQWQKLGLSGLF